MALFFREPARPTEGSAARASLVQTLANALEIGFSPAVMTHRLARAAEPSLGLSPIPLRRRPRPYLLQYTLSTQPQQ